MIYSVFHRRYRYRSCHPLRLHSFCIRRRRRAPWSRAPRSRAPRSRAPRSRHAYPSILVKYRGLASPPRSSRGHLCRHERSRVDLSRHACRDHL